MPEVLISQRQKGARDLKIASLFRDGDAETAFEMKREDGTAHLVEGDYDQVVQKIADLYIERTDTLQTADKRMGVTITTLTNSEASDISQAIRKRLIQRGAIGTDQTIHKAVYYRGEKAELLVLSQSLFMDEDGRTRMTRFTPRVHRTAALDAICPGSAFDPSGSYA